MQTARSGQISTNSVAPLNSKELALKIVKFFMFALFSWMLVQSVSVLLPAFDSAHRGGIDYVLASAFVLSAIFSIYGNLTIWKPTKTWFLLSAIALYQIILEWYFFASTSMHG